MTPYELIKDTINFYAADPSRRAVREMNCLYLDPTTGNKCAVGRCMVDGTWQRVGGDVEVLFDRFQPEQCLKPEYQHIPKKVWKALQDLHDDDIYWNAEGLTQRGQEVANKLLLKYQTQPS